MPAVAVAARLAVMLVAVMLVAAFAVVLVSVVVAGRGVPGLERAVQQRAHRLVRVPGDARAELDPGLPERPARLNQAGTHVLARYLL